jgi:hypothetical protein
MLDAIGLIKKHCAKGVLIDANLLVLYFLGSTKPYILTEVSNFGKPSRTSTSEALPIID